MADPPSGLAAGRVPVQGLDASRGGRLRPYREVLASRMRAQRSYRASFRLDLASTFLVGFVELAEVLVLWRSVDALGGLTLAQVLLVFGLADFGFSVASVAFGHVDELPTYVRTGRLEVFFLRPQPVLAQLVTSDVALRRLSRVLVGVGAFGAGLAGSGLPATWRSVALLGLGALSGTAIYAAQYVAAGGLQFFLVNGAEMTNAFVYGGRYAATQPASVWTPGIRAVFGYVFPMAFCGYLPVVAALGLPTPGWLPAWLAWCTPVAAVWAWTAALACWRWGVRSYQGAGG